MADAILLDHFTLPNLGPVHLQINWSFDIKITDDLQNAQALAKKMPAYVSRTNLPQM